MVWEKSGWGPENSLQMNPGLVIGTEGEMWWSRETDGNVIIFFDLTEPARGKLTALLLHIKKVMNY
jgi:hypothetical protein